MHAALLALVLAWADPNRPVPDEGRPDSTVWVRTSKSAFAFVRNDNVNAFLGIMSRQGLWIDGLPWHVQTLHVTFRELSADVHRHGRLYHAIFLDHRSGNFVVSPDDDGHVQSLLLK